MQLLGHLWNNYLVHVVDILLVTYVFYRFILLIRGTRAMQVLLGVLIVALLTVITKKIIPFQALGWLLEHFWMIGLIIIAVVFQPELRSALAQLGSEPIMHIFMPASETKAMKELLQTVGELSARRTGALIVIEQETGLRNFIETGVVINGDISRELLLTIFSPSSALHDGAVIVKDSRITAAGCILPIGDLSQKSKDFGTRHLAAIGLSEISDAVVIVVSEETGAISMVHKGRLEYNIPLDVLQKDMEKLNKEKEQDAKAAGAKARQYAQKN